MELVQIETLNRLTKGKNALLSECFENRIVGADELRHAVLSIYEDASLKPPHEIIITEGPLDALEYLEKESVYGERVRTNLADLFFDRAVRKAACLRSSLKTRLSQADFSALQNMIFWDLNFQISKCLMEPMLHALRKQGLLPSSHSLRPAPNPSFADFDWVGFYVLCQEAAIFDDLVSKGDMQFLKNKGGLLYAFENLAVLVPSPEVICRNELFQLHGEGHAALSWKDGTKLYFHNGVAIPAKLVEQPDAITRDEIIAESNAEVRRCYQEVLGSERFGKLLGLLQIDSQYDQFGHQIALYKTKDRDKFANDHIFFAQVVCPSTLRRYFLCVPPTIKSAKEAVAWTFGKSAEEYNPEIET